MSKEKKESIEGELDLGNNPRIRKISFSNLNYAVDIISSYPEDDMQKLYVYALNLFTLIKKVDEEKGSSCEASTIQ